VASGRWNDILGTAKSKSHSAFEIEERHLSPGQPLYVLGLVHRREPTRGEAAYRTVADVAVVGGTEEAKVIVHAGSERDLLGDLRRERTYLDLVLAVLCALTAAVGIGMVLATAL
jgi:hypothetical protein